VSTTPPIYPLRTVACTVTPAGITTPTFDEILSSFKSSVQNIYGADVVLDPDTQDGQLLAILAQAQFDSNMATITTYNSYNPQTAVGTALDSAVQLNGIQRQVPSYSVANVKVIGQAGTNLYGAVAQDNLSRLWDLPTNVTIPPEGEILVAATCEVAGQITAAAHTINVIFTPILGWQSVDNPNPAIPGAPVESDGELRMRQAASTSLTSETTVAALLARVLNVDGVRQATLYNNDTGVTDSNGIPGHSFGIVVDGGTDLDVATAIEQAKDVGAGTAGDTTVAVPDPSGIPIPIKFYRIVLVPIAVEVTVRKLPGFQAVTVENIKAALVAFVNPLAIGEDVYLSWMEASASLTPPESLTFVVTGVKQSRDGAPAAAADITIGFREAATLIPDDVTLLLENP
jgi:uncharacterized phage protein gp47/JayE